MDGVSCLAQTLLRNALFMVAQLCRLFSGDVSGQQSFLLPCCSILALPQAPVTAWILHEGLGEPCLQLPVPFWGLSGSFCGAVAPSHSGTECVWALLSPQLLTGPCGTPKPQAGDGLNLTLCRGDGPAACSCTGTLTG